MVTFDEGPKVGNEALGGLAIAALSVGHTGVRVEADARAELGEATDEWSHGRDVGNAVDADAEGLV